jgi:hypothetical protein
MNPQNRRKFAGRVIKAAEAALAAKNYVSPVDVLVGIGWLDSAALKRWQQGQVDYLERVVQTNLSRISEAMKLFRSWAAAKGLVPKERTISRGHHGTRRCALAKAEARRSNSCTALIGFQVSCPKANVSAWRRRQAVHRNWW